MNWLGYIASTLGREGFERYCEIHKRETGAAPICPFLEAVLVEDPRERTPTAGVAADEVRELGDVGARMRREPWWWTPPSTDRGPSAVTGEIPWR